MNGIQALMISNATLATLPVRDTARSILTSIQGGVVMLRATGRLTYLETALDTALQPILLELVCRTSSSTTTGPSAAELMGLRVTTGVGHEPLGRQRQLDGEHLSFRPRSQSDSLASDHMVEPGMPSTSGTRTTCLRRKWPICPRRHPSHSLRRADSWHRPLLGRAGCPRRAPSRHRRASRCCPGRTAGSGRRHSPPPCCA
jgi:hypothetical protein